LKMNQHIVDMYEYIPNEMKMNANIVNPFNDTYYKEVKIDYYKFVDETTN